MNRTGHQVRPAGEADINDVSEILASAFEDYPWTRWTVDHHDHRHRVKALHRLTVAELALPFGEVWVALDGGGAIVSAAVWTRPAALVPPPVWTSIARQQAELEGDRHAQSVAAEAALKALRPTGPHYFLGAVGTHPTHQRRGYALAVLDPVLRRLPHESTDAYLETSTGTNVDFYARLGFEVMAEAVIPDGGPPVWLMGRLAS